jgi:hypothetical protein
MFRFPIGEGILGAMYLVRILFYGFLFVIVSNDVKPIEWMKKTYIVGLIFGILGFIQFILYPNLRNLEYVGWDPHYYRLFSTLFDPNFIGLFLVLTFFAGLLFITKKNCIWTGLMQGMIIIAVALTISRSSIIAFVGASLWIIVYKKAWQYMYLLCIVVAILFLLPIPNKSITPLLRQETGIARLNNWSESIVLFGNRPIVGQGFNLLRSVLQPKYTQLTIPLSNSGAGVDNSFLFILLTTGMVGALGFVYFSYEVWMLGKRLLKQGKQNNFGIVFFSSLIAVCIHSTFNNSLFYPWIFLWLMILLGSGEALVQKNK